MKLAIPVWNGRVSPVFDVAGQLLVVELDGSTEVARRQEALPEEDPHRRAERLRTLGVETLICGAISHPLVALLAAERIEVIPRICGDVEDVLRAFGLVQLQEDRFAMPGCCGRGQRRGPGPARCRCGGRRAGQ